jgi:uncharacterized protein (DUF2267 family)
MSLTGLPAIDSAVHTTNAWIKDLAEAMSWQEDRHRAYQGLRAVLHALRDRLGVQEATDLAAQLPMLVRGAYYEGWHPDGKPLRERRKDQFLAHVAAAIPNQRDTDLEQLTTEVFRLLGRHVSPGEIEDVKANLPEELRALWPAAGEAAVSFGARTQT